MMVGVWQAMIEPTWRRMMDTYADVEGRGFYESRPRRPGDPVWAYNWGFGAVLACAGAICQAGGGDRLTGTDWQILHQGLEGYRRGKRGFASTTRLRNPRLGDTFYDDNAWLGLACLDLAAFDPFFDQSLEIYHFLLRGMDRRSGGVFWKERPRASLHVCSTGPTAVLGARLSRLAAEAIDLSRVQAMMGWLEHMRAPDGRYWDNQAVAQGTMNTTLHTYNTGTPLWAMAILEGLPGFSFSNAVRQSLDGLSGFLSGQGELPPTPWFNAVLLRGMMAVKETYGWRSPLEPAYIRAMDAALAAFAEGDQPLQLPSRDSRRGILLRDAAASVETLALLIMLARKPG